MSLIVVIVFPPGVSGWGDDAHRSINLIAVRSLPEDVPAFFRNSSARLSFLGPEPDRWRDDRQLYKALREASGADHFIDIDNPEEFRALPDDRFKYDAWLRAAGKDPKDIGFLPYASLEAYERVQVFFRLWRDPRYAAERRQIEENVVYYAGVLGHFIGDGANPLHTTVHYNGWTTSLNPDRFSREPLHWRFESDYTQAQVRAEDFAGLVKKAERLADPFSDIQQHILDAHALVQDLYRLEKRTRWDKENRNPESRQFVVKRLAAASQMLANLWYTAWSDSVLPPAGRAR
jgi:hypothetical protein